MLATHMGLYSAARFKESVHGAPKPSGYEYKSWPWLCPTRLPWPETDSSRQHLIANKIDEITWLSSVLANLNLNDMLEEKTTCETYNTLRLCIKQLAIICCPENSGFELLTSSHKFCQVGKSENMRTESCDISITRPILLKFM